MRFMVMLLSMSVCAPAVGADDAAKPVDPQHARNMAAGLALFKSDVRQLLITHCVECHGEQTKGEFSLATRAKLIEGGFEAAGITPGNHKTSHLYRLIAHLDKPHMPHKKPKLADEAIGKIAKWIDLGAPYDKPLIDKAADDDAPMRVTDKDRAFWSFQPLMPWGPPAIRPDVWSRTTLDHFILSKLREKGLTPNPIAGRRTLIRRAYFDLLGLPPTPREVEAFVNDKDPAAYEKLIDRLLESPHYGERWARHWLDVARYGESDGYEQDYDRNFAYHYRDFVIKALNSDMPFDQFARWQIAGDEIEPDNPLAMMATGFLTAGTFPTQLTEREFESARYDQLDDMTNTTTIAFLGLAVGCARCHDHKFDPIPMRDYYELVSTFTTTIRSEPELDISTAAQRAEAMRAYETKLAALEAGIKQFEQNELPKLFAQYVAKVKADGVRPTAWSVLDITDIKTVAGTKFAKQADGSLLKTGDTPAKDTYTFTARTNETAITALRLEALTHGSFPHKGPGLAGNGNFCLGQITITAAPAEAPDKAGGVKLVAARATHEQNKGNLSVASSFDGDPANTGWAVDGGGIGKDHAAVFAFEKPVGFGGGTVLTITLRFDHPNTRHAIGRPRLSVTTADPRTVALTGDGDGVPQRIAAIVMRMAQGEQVGADVVRDARAWFASTLPQYQKLKADLENHRKAGPATHVVKVQVSSEGLAKVKHHADDRGFPHYYEQTHFLNRGDPSQKQGVATQDFLQVLMPKGAAADRWQADPPAGWRTSYRRTALANWLTDTGGDTGGAGHLMARVIVNRLWQQHLGRGIVTTPNDFGAQGDRPTHPMLLEHLAIRLIKEGWKLKPIHKLIMTSAVYMQTTDHDSADARIDPDNRYFWRRDLRRLEAEAIRDSMLAVAGMLDDKMYGPGERSDGMTRRSIYFFLKRSQIPAVLQLFDLPEPLVSQGRRPTTTIAPQALLFMNNPQVQSYARGLAARIRPEAEKSPEAAVTMAYQLALSRPPSQKEVAENVAFIKEQLAAYTQQNKPNALDLALADFCQVVFCLNEFVYVE